MIDQNRRCAILAQGAPEPIMVLAEAVLADLPIRLVTPPSVGTLMLRVREPVENEVFNAGELLVTEARVAAGEHQGYAIRLGRAPEATLAAAVLDVAVAAGHHLAPTILASLSAWEQQESERQAARWRRVAPTRVSFEEMQ